MCVCVCVCVCVCDWNVHCFSAQGLNVFVPSTDTLQLLLVFLTDRQSVGYCLHVKISTLLYYRAAWNADAVLR